MFVLLLVATIASFAIAQRLKREPLVLDKVEISGVFTPNNDCGRDFGLISFRVTRDDRADVEIVTPEGDLVKTLAKDKFLRSYKFFNYHWDGRNNYDEMQPAGRYRLRVHLIDQDRTLVTGPPLRLHDVEPNKRPDCDKKPATQ